MIGRRSETIAGVTVVIPAYNAESSLALTVESVRSTLDCPIVVVDDGSTDQTSSLARSLGCKVLTQANQGASVARSRALTVVETEFVVMLDSDDRLLPGVVELVKRLLSDASIGCAAGGILVEDGRRRRRRPIYPVAHSWTTGELVSQSFSPAPPSACVWRVDALRKAAALPVAALRPRFAEDFETLIRVSLVANVVTVRVPATLYNRVGGKSAANAATAVRDSERIRVHYATCLQLPVRLLTDQAIEDQAVWRELLAAYASGGILAVGRRYVSDARAFSASLRHTARRVMRALTRESLS